ncbi:MAG: hypothetical protein ACREHG_06120 [Candidatus Saccharimonadales bacterium]
MSSMRAAINAKCKECIYDPIAGNGTWRQQVEACTAHSCPLYELRPKSASADAPTTPPPIIQRRSLQTSL